MRPVGLSNNNPPPQRNQSATNAGNAGDAGIPGYNPVTGLYVDGSPDGSAGFNGGSEGNESRVSNRYA